VLPSRERVPAAQLPPTGTQHEGTWYGIPCSVWPGVVSPPGCAPSWIPVKTNPVLAEPRTKVLTDTYLRGSAGLACFLKCSGRKKNRNQWDLVFNLPFSLSETDKWLQH